MEHEIGRIGLEKDDLLTLEQVAVHLQVSRRTIERYVKSGLLTVIRLSARKVRVLRSDRDAFIDRMRQPHS